MDEMSIANAVTNMLGGRRGEDSWGGGWIWIILLFFLFGGNGGMFGRQHSDVATKTDVAQALADNRLSADISVIGQNQYNNQYELGRQFASLNENVNASRFASQQCCCGLEKEILQSRYDMSKAFCEQTGTNALMTRDIIANQTAGFQRVIDQMTATETNRLREELTAERLKNQNAEYIISNLNQNAYLISQLRPFPQPCYVTCSPYTSASSTICGGCGA